MRIVKSTIDDFKDYETLWESRTSKRKSKKNGLHEDLSSYGIYVDGSNKKLEKDSIEDTQALQEIIEFINSLSREEKENVSVSWFWVEDNGDQGDLVVSVYSRSELEHDPEYIECGVYGDRTISNWDYAEKEIQKALGIKSLY